MKPKYGENIRMVNTDTDSFVFHTKTDGIVQDLKEINDEMDFSGYDKNHKFYDATNKKVLGKFKDECEGKIVTGFIGLRPKCYAFKIYGDDKEYKKCKGAAKNTVKRKTKYDDFNKVLETNEVIHRSFNNGPRIVNLPQGRFHTSNIYSAQVTLHTVTSRSSVLMDAAQEKTGIASARRSGQFCIRQTSDADWSFWREHSMIWLQSMIQE